MKKLEILSWLKVVMLVVFSVLLHARLAADTFYVDPLNGSMSGDGSAANPWSTLQEVFSNNLVESQRPAVYPYNGTLTPRNPGAPIKAGDTIKLLSGHHGDIFERGYFNSDYISIEAEAGHSPELRGFRMQGAKNWKLRGLTLSPELAGVVDAGSIVRFESHGHHGPASDMTIEDSNIFSTADSSTWTASDWTSKAATGIQVSGSNFVIRNNQIKNVDFGILTSGDDILADSNSIENYSGDGMRGGGDRVTFQYNSIKWSYNVDANHDDAIQFYQGAAASHDVVLRGNYILSYADPLRPLTHGSQGLGNFDGPYIDWVVENNVVMTAHHHGISLYDAENAQVVNNTVLDISGQFDPWIQLNNATDSTMRNNLAEHYIGSSGITSDHNITLNSANLISIFEDWQNGDLRLKAGSSAIDAGSSILAPAFDIDGNPRPVGPSVDIGAYEYFNAADFDRDGDVDGDDHSEWKTAFGATILADADADGDSDGADFLTWQREFGFSTESQPLSFPVPEPRSWLLCIIGLLSIAVSSNNGRLIKR